MGSESLASQTHGSGNRPKKGRSAPRSRNGCVMCKQRRVRCDEVRPTCCHCTRLELQCVYRKRPLRSQRDSVGALSNHRSDQSFPNGEVSQDVFRDQSAEEDFQFATTERGSLDPLIASRAQQNTKVFTAPDYQLPESLPRWLTDPNPDDHYNFSLGRTFDPPNGQDSLGIFTFSDVQSNFSNWGQEFNISPSLQDSRSNNGVAATAGTWSPSIDRILNSHPQPMREGDPNEIDFSPGSDYMNNQRSIFLLSYFKKITQPPASLLITGVHQWRRLQRYFTKLSHQHRAVASALFAIIELLAKDDRSITRADTLDNITSMGPILTLQEVAKKEIEIMMSKGWHNVSQRDALLASIFLLAWFEVVRDQVYDQKMFPADLAEEILTSSGPWNRYSKRLLEWFNTLDSKASHLGGQHLLTQKALQAVSEHHTQINPEDSSDECPSEDDATNHSFPTPQDQQHLQSPSTTGAVISSPRGNGKANSPLITQTDNHFKSVGHMKTVLLNTILQPGLDWYQSTQRYCRLISTHDRHHRSRFTVKDEYEVVIAGKRLELELMHLWRQRPQVVRLSTLQLREIVCSDIALRLEAIFSLYMASFWILFVYLHRVVWWHLPHSETTERALEEAWRNLQRSFGEVVEGEKKVVHPALLWPLFMFGSEAKEEARQAWAVEQLMALGNANAVVNCEDEGESLAPFRLSLGATKNAKRAAVLLQELIRRQNERKCRVDDKELSLEMFGCHFSII